MPTLYPLRFQPLFKRYVWGGRRLAALLGKRLAAGETCAESWEAVDHGQDQSVVANGPLAGETLHHLVEKHGAELFGRHHPQRQFPLLFKFLDAEQTLSVQVHPNDAQAARLDPPDLGKTEAWVVLAAKPGSKIYAGLNEGVDRNHLAAAIDEGTSAECLHAFEPSVGDCVFIQAGTVHALGAGLVIAEIQQASNTTFRLFDWNRTDADGKSRPLHMQESLATIDFSRGAVHPQMPKPTGTAGVERLVACDKFVLERGRRSDPLAMDLGDRFHLVSVIAGQLQVTAPGGSEQLEPGDTLLVPACLGQVELRPAGECQWLDMYLPD